jgi:ubiquitin-activating enzyme E1
MCTIKSFPYEIHHTIQWARELFNTYFVEHPTMLNKFFANPDEFQNELAARTNEEQVTENDFQSHVMSFATSFYGVLKSFVLINRIFHFFVC